MSIRKCFPVSFKRRLSKKGKVGFAVEDDVSYGSDKIDSSESNIKCIAEESIVDDCKTNSVSSFSDQTITENRTNLSLSPSDCSFNTFQRIKETKSQSKYKVKYQKIYGEEDDAYNNNTLPRGRVFVCNFERFESDTYPKRKGSQQDYYNIIDVLFQMGYGNVKNHFEHCFTGFIKKEEFMRQIKKFSELDDHRYLGSCIIVIMSHGCDEKTFVTSDNKEVELNEVYDLFSNWNCKNLQGKPKLFILQFCRSRPDKAKSSSLNLDEHCEIEKYKMQLQEQVMIEIEGLRKEYECKMKDLNEQIDEINQNSTCEDLNTPTNLPSTPNSCRRTSLDTISNSSRIRDFNLRCSATSATCATILKTPKPDNLSQSNTLNFTYDEATIERYSISSQISFHIHEQEALQISEDFNKPTRKRSLLRPILNIETPSEVANCSSLNTDGKALNNPDNERKSEFQKCSDIYSIFPSSSGDVAYRDTVEGSLLIQSLCYVFANFAYMDDIETLVRKVSAFVFT